MRSLGATLRHAGLAAVVATLGVGMFAPAALAASQHNTGVRTANTSDCMSPPAGFDPLTASDAQLQVYGLPLRPDASSSLYTQWVVAVTHATKRGCEDHIFPSIEVVPHKHGRTEALSTNGGNWSGWEDNNSTYYAASGQ